MAVTYWCEAAWLPPGEVARGVVVDTVGARVNVVRRDVPAPPAGARRLRGLVLPGLANTHSHAFHRALRGRTHGSRGDFWTWRDRMYEVAARLDPDSYLALARAAYAEMALAGMTAVGEFHYLHHGRDGTPYGEPGAMSHALVQAVRDAGLRVALLDTCYLTGGIEAPLQGPQVRFGDGDADRWAARADEVASRYEHSEDVVPAAAIHSVRAVPRDQVPAVAAWAAGRAAPLHFHLSEQRAENTGCARAYGRTPTQVMADGGALGPRATAVHATHVGDADVALLGRSGTGVCLCPTTERDLADGIGPARRLYEAGSTVSVGSDSHAVVDGFEEARAIELHERLVTEERGHWSTARLLAAATTAGHTSLGFPEAGAIAPGAWADLVAVRLDSVRTAGARLHGPGGTSADATADSVVFAATAADVTDVVASGRRIVTDGVHLLGDVGELLRTAIETVTRW